MGYRSVQRTISHEQQEAHTDSLIYGLQALQSTMLDVVTSQRAYLLTNAPEFEVAYTSAMGTWREQMQQVSGLLKDDSAQRQRLEQANGRMGSILGSFAEARSVARTGAKQEASLIASSLTSKRSMDRLRADLAEIESVERERMVAHAANSAHWFKTMVYTIGTTAALGVLITLVLLSFSMRQAEQEKQHARSIAAQRESLRITLASIGDGVITTDASGRVRSLNAVAEGLTGWTTEEAVDQPLNVVFHIVREGSREEVDNPAMRALREGRVVGLANHTILIARDGKEHHIDDSAAPIRSEDGSVSGCVLIFRDIGEQRSSTRALELSEARKTAMFESALDCVITMDHLGTIVEFNAAAERTFGHSREAAVGSELADLIVPPQYREAHRKGMARYLSTGHGPVLNKRLELSAMRADGTEFPCELTVTRVPMDGAPLFTAYLRDISERRRAEETLRLSEAFNRVVIESSPDCLQVLDTEGHLIRMNANGLKQMEMDDFEQFKGKAWCDLWPQIDRQTVLDAVESARQSGIGRFLRACPTAKGTTKWWDVSVAPIRDVSQTITGFVSVSRDITEQRLIEEETRANEQRLRQLAAQLSQTDRRKNEFLAMLAHELRNPLASIRNAIELIDMNAGREEEHRAVLGMMQRQVGQMVRLVDDLLDVSRVSTGKIGLRMEPVEMAEVMQHAIEAVRPGMHALGQELALELPGTPMPVHGDPARLAQVISNLLNNASKFSPAHSPVRLKASVTNSEVVITIQDQGIGLSPDQLPYIFDLFVQADTSLERSTSGLGIGLTLVKSLLHAHNGSITVESEGLGHGSTFTVRLPLHRTQQVARLPNIPSTTGRGHSRKVLIVDDNRDAASSLSLILELAGHTVRTAFDGLEAVVAAGTFRPEIILLDIGLPNLNGYEVAKRIRQQDWGRNVHLIALTGWGQEEDRLRSKEAGFNKHMVKPVDLNELRRMLAGVEA